MKHNDYMFPKCQWPEHFTNGGTGVTRYLSGDDLEERLRKINETVAAFNNPAVWMKGNDLHSTLRDLSDFWKLHSKLHPSQP